MRGPRLLAAVLTVSALVLGACGTGGGGSGNDAATEFASCSVTAGVADARNEPVGNEDVIIAAFVGWDESAASAYLMGRILADNGYNAQVKTLDIGVAFSATADGIVNALTDVWLPTTHRSYIDQYRARMEPLGCWYDHGRSTIAVNSSSPARSIADLATMGSDYGNTIVGIEPGAGETKLIQNSVIPEYGLEKLTLRSTSTAEMLAALEQAHTDRTNIAVVMWRPNWAYAAFDIRDLEDPKGTMGGQEGLWNFATKGFTDRSPRAAQMFTNLILSDENIAGLEELMVRKYGRADPEAAVSEWLTAHPDFEDRLVSGTLT
ncbi:putative glycine betaine ABC transporter substrate-binding protein [Gordonia rhizosphera NBRC 16068]|uniref:Putative glycine betaine ABC transporter substrate-binding protein n=2 Tax=Gordonia rhizosphera TaxID=83341 RepID=K6VXR1_9ACTN|nr:putative glycine betaine ABC transporter substrate-binding protein [Gordonia rhizosphera NBRC 16068]